MILSQGEVLSTPRLAIVVDTEEEFDWTQPLSRANQMTSSIPGQCAAHRIYDVFGVIPTYVLDYPVATNPEASNYLNGLRMSGRAEIGAHLHPWVTPPDEEEVSSANSYLCNLPPELQRAKIEVLHRAIIEAFGVTPTIFKAGRYGFGSATAEILADMGYEIDCSQVPHSSFAGDGGPTFYQTPTKPYWLDAAKTLLEVPVTTGFFGKAPRLGERLAPLFDSAHAARLRLPGILARSGLVSRARLTPEGVSAAEQISLIRAMHARGERVFTMTYHSPSLVPGHTPYVRDAAGLEHFLETIRTVLTWFRDELGGAFTTLNQIRNDMLVPAHGPASHEARQEYLPRAQGA